MWDAIGAAFGFAFFMWYTVIFVPSTDNIALVGGLSFNVTTWTKLFFMTVHHKELMSLINYIFKVLRLNSTGARQRILLDVTKKVDYHLNVNIVGISAGCAVFSAFPMYDCIFNGKLTPVSSMVTPFTVNDHGLRGYLINSFFNVLFVLYGLSLGIATSSLFFVFVDAYYGLVLLIEHEIGQFDAMCEEKEANKNYDAPFRNIMMMFMDLARFNIYVRDLYAMIATVQVTASYLVVVTCVGGFMAFDYVGGIGAGVALYTEILIYCYIGQLQNNTNERILEVFGNSKWYTYDVKYQKDMQMALHIAQEMKSIELANVHPLNFETGLSITRSIYTFIMFMIEMID